MITVRDYLKVLRKRWVTVVALAFVGLAVAGALSYAATKQYTATASVYFSLPSGTSGSDLSQGSNFTQSQMLSYAEIAAKPIVLDKVIDQLQLGTTAKKLAESVEAVASRDTVVIELSVVDPSPAQSAAIANSVAQKLADTAKSLSPRTAGGDASVNATIVAVAQPPTVPSSPKTTRNITAGLLAGLFLGMLAGWGRELLDTSIRSTDVLQAVSRIPVLGSISFDKSADRSPLVGGANTRSRRAEAYRQLRTALQFTHVDRPAQVVVVTSSMAAEGKSLTAANLAVTVAEAGTKVLLIEADLRRPRVCDYLGVERSVGLTNVLAGQVEVHDVVQPWMGGNISVLASGFIPPNPSELLGSQAMVDLLQTLRAEYDMVIIDTPPLLPVTDGAVVAAHADGVILVARYGRTRHNQIAASVASLRAVDAEVLGSVLNFTPVRGDSPGTYDGYGYYAQDGGRPSGRLRDRLRWGRSGAGAGAHEAPATPGSTIRVATRRPSEGAAPGIPATPSRQGELDQTSATPASSDPLVAREDVRPENPEPPTAQEAPEVRRTWESDSQSHAGR